MADAGIHGAELILILLLLFVAAFAALARKLETPYPIVLVIAGLILGFVPGMPRVELEPNVIFVVILPPLLYSAAVGTAWEDFRYNIISIVMLAVGLVGFTVFAVAAAGPLLLPGFDWRTGFVLGAVVATTDAVAATSIARRVGLPKRIVDILEGESLVNDATGLLALEFGTTIVLHGNTPTVSSGILRLLYLIVAGIVVGLILGRIIEWFEFRIDDAPIEIAISIFVPYAAYLAGEAIKGSGILAVVAAGLYLGRKSSLFFSPSVRLQTNAVWNALTFILNGLVFVLIGLQLPYVLGEIKNFRFTQLLLYATIFCAFLIILRVAWSFPGAYFAYLIQNTFLNQNEKRPGARRIFIVGWTGMRGVIALAAAMSLPVNGAGGEPLPHRNLIIFLTFSLIIVTLVLQGLTLPTLIRRLGLAGSKNSFREEQEARRAVAEAALQRLSELRERDLPDFDELYEDVAQHYQRRLESFNQPEAPDGEAKVTRHRRYVDVSRELLGVERAAAFKLRRQGRISDEIARELERELDLNETRLNTAARRGPRKS
jgi:CPA1 family monovalent cation:H+ antiporter